MTRSLNPNADAVAALVQVQGAQRGGSGDYILQAGDAAGFRVRIRGGGGGGVCVGSAGTRAGTGVSGGD